MRRAPEARGTAAPFITSSPVPWCSTLRRYRAESEVRRWQSKCIPFSNSQLYVILGILMREYGEITITVHYEWSVERWNVKRVALDELLEDKWTLAKHPTFDEFFLRMTDDVLYYGERTVFDFSEPPDYSMGVGSNEGVLSLFNQIWKEWFPDGPPDKFIKCIPVTFDGTSLCAYYAHFLDQYATPQEFPRLSKTRVLQLSAAYYLLEGQRGKYDCSEDCLSYSKTYIMNAFGFLFSRNKTKNKA